MKKLYVDDQQIKDYLFIRILPDSVRGVDAHRGEARGREQQSLLHESLRSILDPVLRRPDGDDDAVLRLPVRERVRGRCLWGGQGIWH